MMMSWLKKVHAAIEAERAKEQAESEARARAEVEVAKAKLTPLETRLARLLATIPREVQEEGLSLTALQHQLRARGRGHSRCHIGELGEACRRNGLVRKRRWRDDAGGFRALWYPV